jgi:hypothetical protein
VTKALSAPAPEWLEVANEYLTTQSTEQTARNLDIPLHTVSEVLARKDVRTYLNEIYLDTGYRNKSKLGALMDRIIESKLEEAEESGMYSSKDLLEIIALVHKMRMDELKLNTPDNQTNVQINTSIGGNYGKLMEQLLSQDVQANARTF